MPLRNGLPLAAPAPWSASVPGQLLQLVTQWDLSEKAALAAPPDPDLAWADVGTFTALGSGIVKVPHTMPSALDFKKFKPGDTRTYETLDAVVTTVQSEPLVLNFGIPMIWDRIGNGYLLKNPTTDAVLTDFMGMNDTGEFYVMAGKAYKAQLVGNLLYTGMYCTTANGVSMTSPTALAYGGDAQGAATGGIALFTDGSGAAGSVGDKHYANPRVQSSARFQNVFAGYGEFSANYGRSLVAMTQIPHPTLANKYSGARVTDTLGPSYMRDKFWRMMVESLVLTTATVSGTPVGAATSNPYAILKAAGITEDNFLGQTIQTAFGPRRFWISSEMDNHPYVTANPNTNGTGIAGDMWVNVSAGAYMGKKRPTWAKLVCNSRDFVPVFHFYGPGDPRAQSELLMRFEGDLDAGATGGAPGEVQVFFQA